MILKIDGLVKRYKSITAVDGISFSIREGTCFGLLGQNGAGKTTTVEMLEDIITPTSGTILINFISWPMMFLSGVWFSLEGARSGCKPLPVFCP
jgi:ABC-type multidrug transport system ATPase subunit